MHTGGNTNATYHHRQYEQGQYTRCSASGRHNQLVPLLLQYSRYTSISAQCSHSTFCHSDIQKSPQTEPNQRKRKNMTTEPMDTTTQPLTNTSQNPSSTPKKRSHSTTQQQPTTSKSLTLRSPPWSYIHLQQYTQQQAPNPLDALTAHIQITSALNQFLGLHGAAVPIDILKLEGSDVWIRVPSGDHSAVVAAVGGWVGRGGEGWRVVGWSSWSAGAEGGKDAGREVFGN